MKAIYGKPSYEVARANEAAWAPAIPGQTFNGNYWAYRIKTPTGNIIIGAVRGTRQTAENTAKNYIDRALFHRPFWAASQKKGRPRITIKPAKPDAADDIGGETE